MEGQNLDLRVFLQKYEIPIEGQRHRLHTRRQALLEGHTPCVSELERLITLRTIDDLWAEYLARVADYRSGVHWLSLGGRDPHREYLKTIHQWFPELEAAIPLEIEKRLADAASGSRSGSPGQRRSLDLCDHRSAIRNLDGEDRPRSASQAQKSRCVGITETVKFRIIKETSKPSPAGICGFV